MNSTSRYSVQLSLRSMVYGLILFISLSGVSASARAADQISDRLAIAEQLARYAYAADAKDLDGFIALFTERAVFRIIPYGQTEPNMVLNSREEIEKFSADLNQQNANIRSSHHLSNLLFTELTKNTARTRIMNLVTIQGPDDPAPKIVVSGVYYDTWQKTAKGWLIETHTLRMQALPLTDN